MTAGKRASQVQSLRSLAAAAGCDIGEYSAFDDDFHIDLLDEILEVNAILRPPPGGLATFLLDCVSCDVKVAVRANAPDSVAVGDFVMLPEEIGELPDEWFMLRPLISLQERNSKILVIADLLKPHLGTMAEFLKSTGAVNVTAGIEIHIEPEVNYVSAVASVPMSDGTLVALKFEVLFSNLLEAIDGPTLCDGHLVATRERSDTGEHVEQRDRLAFIEAGHALSRRPVQLRCTKDLFESGDAGAWVLEVDAPLAIAGLNVRSELLGLDLSPLRLDTLFS
ncbi:hypothetical protein [Variovorax sp. LjRoot178]|uniref:hypothetical protein n=1 Tax=Variovorax sp. LjRoot178 TaxID=3342277 RepID=UPI003ED0289E